MAGAKIMVMYPRPKDMAAFERDYNDEHIPMAASIFKAAGALKAVLSKGVGAPSGDPAFHRIAEIHFRSMADLQACAASRGGQDALAHAHKISSGGPPVIVIAEEDVVTL
jgi:uncharacterized protein (TIGR02118 family)